MDELIAIAGFLLGVVCIGNYLLSSNHAKHFEDNERHGRGGDNADSSD